MDLVLGAAAHRHDDTEGRLRVCQRPRSYGCRGSFDMWAWAQSVQIALSLVAAKAIINGIVGQSLRVVSLVFQFGSVSQAFLVPGAAGVDVAERLTHQAVVGPDLYASNSNIMTNSRAINTSKQVVSYH